MFIVCHIAQTVIQIPTSSLFKNFNIWDAFVFMLNCKRLADWHKLPLCRQHLGIRPFNGKSDPYLLCDQPFIFTCTFKTLQKRCSLKIGEVSLTFFFTIIHKHSLQLGGIDLVFWSKLLKSGVSNSDKDKNSKLRLSLGPALTLLEKYISSNRTLNHFFLWEPRQVLLQPEYRRSKT